jgi:hypothetical protein
VDFHIAKGKGTGDELGSSDDLKDCQEGRAEEIPDCQEGNRIEISEDLKDCHEDSEGISHCQLGNDQRSLRGRKARRLPGGQRKHFKLPGGQR